MIFHRTPLEGAWLIEPERIEDARGYFARVRCEREFAEHGLNSRWVQSSVSQNTRRGTLRGMHFQAAPHGEIKLVRCTRGAIFDVIIDLRPQSKSYMQHFSVRLSEENHTTIYIPEGLAHGFLTLEDGTEVLYEMSEFYHAESARGVRWNDPAFGIAWPEEPRILIERDRNYADYKSVAEFSRK